MEIQKASSKLLQTEGDSNHVFLCSTEIIWSEVSGLLTRGYTVDFHFIDTISYSEPICVYFICNVLILSYSWVLANIKKVSQRNSETILDINYMMALVMQLTYNITNAIQSYTLISKLLISIIAS